MILSDFLRRQSQAGLEAARHKRPRSFLCRTNSLPVSAVHSLQHGTVVLAEEKLAIFLQMLPVDCLLSKDPRIVVLI